MIRICTEEDMYPFVDMENDREEFTDECPDCGQILGWDDLLEHDEKACIKYMEFERKHYNIS